MIFVSCGGMDEVMLSYAIAEEGVKFMLGPNAKALALVDRSNSRNYNKDKHITLINGEKIEKTNDQKIVFTDIERDKFLKAYADKGASMLKRKEIENYLYDPTVTKLLPDVDRQKIDLSSIKGENYIQGEVKDHIKLINISSRDIKEKLAKIIRDHKEKETKEIYDEILSFIKK